MSQKRWVRPERTVWNFAFIAVLSLSLLPIAGVARANGNKSQNQRIGEIIRDARATIRDIQSGHKQELRNGILTDKTVPDENFTDTIKTIGSLFRNTERSLHSAQKNLVQGLQNEYGSSTPDDTNRNALPGTGGLVDRIREATFWGSPVASYKFLEGSARRIKLGVEFPDEEWESSSRGMVGKANFSMVTNQKLRQKILFSQGVYESEEAGPTLANGIMIPTKRARISFVLGGGVNDPVHGDFTGLGCVFGTSSPWAKVDVMAIGLSGSFGQTVEADSNGEWNADFEVGPGITLYGAVNEESSDKPSKVEMGLLQVDLKFKF